MRFVGCAGTGWPYHGVNGFRNRKGRAGVPLSSAEELAETGLTSIRYVYRMFDLLHIRTETLPSAYAGRLL